MKFSCEKTALAEAVNIVQRAIVLKNPNPILDCIKIDADMDGHIELTGNNLELCIEYSGTCRVFEPGTIALNSKIFGEIVRRLPDGIVTVEIDERNNVTTITCGSSEFNIQGMYAEEYPSTPAIEILYSFTLKEQELKNIIRKTIPFTAMSEGSKPAQVGVLFELENDDLTAVSSDGKRLSVITRKLSQTISKNKFILPGSTLRELIKILKDEDNEIKIMAASRHVLIDCGNYKVFTRLVDGEFLRYAPIIKAPNTIFAHVKNSVITESLERAILLINEDDSGKDIKIPVRFNIGDDRIEVSSMTAKGKVYDIVPAKTEGSSLTIGFNCKFMLDVLRVCDSEDVTMEFSAPTGGCFIKSGDEEGTELFMILPVRLNG